MELTAEQFHQEIRALEQRLDQKLEKFRESIIRWVVGVFLGTLLLTLSAIGLYTSILIGVAGLGWFE